MKAKIYAVQFAGITHLVRALTKAGACRDLLEHLGSQCSADLATGEQLYEAGASNKVIVGDDAYKNPSDPAQLPLAGVPETAAQLTAAQEAGDTPAGDEG